MNIKMPMVPWNIYCTPAPPRSFNSSTLKSCLVTPIGRWLVFQASIFSGAFAVELRDGFCDHLNTAYTAIHFDQSPLRKEVLHIPFSVLRREGTPAIWQWNPPFDVFSKNSVTSSCWCWIGKPKKEKHSKTHCEGSSNQPECFIGKNGPLHEDGPNAATIAHHARVAWRKLPQLPLTCCKKCGSSDGEK